MNVILFSPFVPHALSHIFIILGLIPLMIFGKEQAFSSNLKSSEIVGRSLRDLKKKHTHAHTPAGTTHVRSYILSHVISMH